MTKEESSERGKMDQEEVRRCWDGNADAWTKLSRAGYDTYRDHLNTPAFFHMLPDVNGLTGLDIGCGEGHNTRLLARRGARMAAVDISKVFLRHAVEENKRNGLRIDTMAANAAAVPFASESFDFATAFMSFMDVGETPAAIRAAYRVIKPGGFLQFSITHPCFDTPHHRQLKDADGKVFAVEVGDYFRPLDGEVGEWLFSAAPPEAKSGLPMFRVPRFTRTLSRWVSMLVETGFRIERMEEPYPSDETVKAYPKMQDAQVWAYFLIVRVRKPA
jgi:ubiquinone/menaquinone biosynthesis C-methylase UbiE